MQNAENEIRPVDLTGNSRQELGAESGSNNCSPVPANDERMEPIAEENSPKSFDCSFSFVSVIFFIIRLFYLIKLTLIYLAGTRRFKALGNF